MKKTNNKPLIIFGVIILIIFFVPLFRGIFNLGNQFGMALGITLIFCGVFIEKLKKLIKKLCSKKIGKAFIYTTSSAIIIFMLAFVVTFTYVVINAFPSGNANGTLIVLGCQVRGTSPSLQLHERIVTAKDILEDSDEVAILSGGKGSGENISEAYCMYNNLTNMGLSPDRLYLEDASTNTQTNFKNSYEIIEKNSLNKDICIVSSNYHIGRAKIIAKQTGFENITSCPANTNIFAFPTYAAREVFAIWYLIIFA